MKLRKSILLLAGVVMAANGSASVADIENVTLNLELESPEAFADGKRYTGSFVSTDFSSAYVVNGEPSGIIGFSLPLKISYTQGSPDRFSVTQSRGDFILTSTKGGPEALVPHLDSLGSGFLNELSPSFGFPQETDRYVEASYTFPFNVTEFEGPSDFNEIVLRNRFNSDNSTELRIRTR